VKPGRERFLISAPVPVPRFPLLVVAMTSVLQRLALSRENTTACSKYDSWPYMWFAFELDGASKATDLPKYRSISAHEVQRMLTIRRVFARVRVLDCFDQGKCLTP